ncbi:MAG: acyltransferase family protein [Cyclobacteriaceae bacterium]|nr:acyltransferase family protein [Cyclobacteriaceae bacterium]
MEVYDPRTDRRHDLDWLRLIAIFILLFFHTGMWFNQWSWHVKNNETTVSFQYWMVWLHYWRMPLLLFISGAGTYMALGKRTPRQFATERFRRLFIPLVFGMFVVVPPQIYYEHIADYESYAEFYRTVFSFVPYPAGSFSWHHLWFVAYLLVYSLIALPFLIYLRSAHSRVFRQRVTKLLSHPMGMLWIPSGIILLSQVILRPYFPEETHDLIHDGAFFVFYLSFFAGGMIMYASPALWESAGRHRKTLVGFALLILIPFYVCYFSLRGITQLPLTKEQIELTFDVTAIFLSWFTVMAVIGVGQHYLNRPKPWLQYVNEGLYPFYILHQTVIIVIGYYICQLPWSIMSKFWAISFLTLLCCVSFFWLLIRPFALMRILFGLKPKGRTTT